MSGDLTHPTKILNGRYRLQGLIARGGMGAVFRALDLQTNRQVAVKHLLPEALTTDPTLRARVIREGEALRQLDHPNIVKLLDTFEETGLYHLVLEYIDGGSLAKMIEGYGALPYHRALGIAIEIVDALARAHHLKIVHRDLKPSNILIMSSGTPKLTDFGTALLKSRERLTMGDAMPGGTVEWAAPEVLSGASADERSDIWSMGLVLYTMLAGKHPFQGNQLTDTLSNIFGAEPIPLTTLRSDVPEAMDDLVRKMLNKEPARRPATVRLIGAQLETIAMATSGGRPASQSVAPEGLRAAKTVPRTQALQSPTSSSLPVFEPKHNLPAQPTAFIGRSEESQAVIDLLGTPTVRLVTLIAPGGMGKTRLALEVAERCVPDYPDGVYFVPLAAHATLEAVITAIADAVGFTFITGMDVRQQLLEFLHNKALLLVLDNFEHLLNAATLLADMISAAPRLKIIATSREKLDVQGEHLYTLAPMDIPDERAANPRRYSAVQLFEQGARRARPSYELTNDDLAAVITICRYVEGVPLGILLAAGWVEALTPAEIAAEIKRDPDFLETSGRDVPERQRSLRATFDYSWKLLNDDDRDALARVSVFYGGFTRDAAQVVAGTSLRALLSLTSKSLVRRDAETGAFSLHDIIRQYAAEKLAAMGLLEAVRLAHSDFYLNQLASRRPAFEGRGQLEAFRAQAAESDNLLAAVQYAVENRRTVVLARALHAYGLYAEFRGNRLEAQSFADPVLRVLQTQPPGPERDMVTARALAWYGRISVAFGDQTDAELCLRQARQLAPSPASLPDLEALLQLAEGAYALYFISASEARAHLQLAETLYREQSDRHGLSQALTLLGRAHWERISGHERDLYKARLYHTEALDIQRAIGDRFGEAQSLLALGTVTLLGGQPENAIQLLNEARSHYLSIGSAIGAATAQTQLAKAANALARYDDARSAIQEAIQTMERHGQTYQLLLPRIVQIEIELEACNYSRARDFAEAALAEAQGVNAHYQAAVSAYLLAQAALALGQYPASVVRYQLSRQIAEKIGFVHLALYAALGEGLALIQMEQTEKAHHVFSAAQDRALNGLMLQGAAARIGLGACALQSRDYEAAVDLFTQGLDELEHRPEGYLEWENFVLEQWRALALVGLCDARIAIGDRSGGMSALRAAMRHVQTAVKPAYVLGIAAAYAEITSETAPFERTSEITARVLNDPRAFVADQARAQRALDRIRLKMSAWSLEQSANRGRAMPLEELVKRVLTVGNTGLLRG
jgi:non-specific serine/threonine protein kinase